jgi:hypothetical protein
MAEHLQDVDPMAAHPTCGSCKYWDPEDMPGEYGCCHYWPPLAHLMGLKTVWPICLPDDWCGQWVAASAPVFVAYWKYRANVTMNDPSNGNVRFNQTNLSAATAAVISNKTEAGLDVTAELATLTTSDEIELRSADTTRWIRYRLTAPVAPKTGYAQLAVTSIASQNPVFTDAEQVALRWTVSTSTMHQAEPLPAEVPPDEPPPEPTSDGYA